MAVFRCRFFSQSLLRDVHINVILPADQPQLPGQDVQTQETYPTLYLLHGILGSEDDWLNHTNIQDLSIRYGIAIVMPAGENQFYVDQRATHALYGEFIGQELVNFTRKVFPLSPKQSDTMIAGLSMGGYGALRNGLKYQQTFGMIGAFSSALIISDLSQRQNTSPIPFETRKYAEAVFGHDLEAVSKSDKNPIWLAERLSPEKKNQLKIFMTCGNEDGLLQANQRTATAFSDLGVAVRFEHWRGKHDWNFWQESLTKFLTWLELDPKQHQFDPGQIRTK